MIIKEADLAQPLLAFSFAFYILTVLWAEVRRKHPLVLSLVNNVEGAPRQFFKKGKAYRLLILSFTTIVVCYSMYPALYRNFMPIAALDNTWINIAGLLLLFVSVIWIVVVQVDFDKEISYSNTGMSVERMLQIARKIRFGYLLMFSGLTLILASMLSVALLLVAIHLRKD
jgi:hypothetical protein